MKKLNLEFQNFGNVELLTRSQLKKIMGGYSGSGNELCLGCEADSDCSAVGKGKCRSYPDCNGGVKCCTGWTSC